MNVLARPPGNPVQTILRVLLYVVPGAILLLVIVIFLGDRPAVLDDNLCPVDQPPARTTILLLDTSDPLSPKHRAELARLVSEMQRPSPRPDTEHFYVAPGEALVVYELAADWRSVEPIVEVCNPGDNPEEWDWKKDMTRGKAFALHNWSRFEKRAEELFPDDSGEEMPRSPILENLGVIMPRHVPSKRSLSAEDSSQSHLIVFSDLLQNSDRLSHYGVYPTAKDFMGTPHLRELATDLTRIHVSLFRLERSRYSRHQTRDHYYWWTELVGEFGGTLRWQQSL